MSEPNISGDVYTQNGTREKSLELSYNSQIVDLQNEDNFISTREPMSAMEALAKFESQHCVMGSRKLTNSSEKVPDNERARSGPPEGKISAMYSIQTVVVVRFGLSFILRCYFLGLA